MKAVHTYRLFLLRMITSSRLMWILGFIVGTLMLFHIQYFKLLRN